MLYDCIIIGGGIAGLQAAIQMGRYEHSVLVVDSGQGRSSLCRSYHNLLGWPDGISGEQLRALGRKHAESLNVQFVQDEIVDAVKENGHFRLSGRANGPVYEGLTLLLATGVMDRFPDLPGLKPCLGLTVYVCPDCDGYEIRGRKTIVMGSGDAGAKMALALSERTADLTYVNHERRDIDEKWIQRLKERRIPLVNIPIVSVIQHNDGQFAGVKLASGETLGAERGFIAFGGNEVKSRLAAKLGVERMENRHIITDPRTKMTSVPGVWAAGDVCVHSEQVTIAMGEGSQAAIWIHKALHEKKDTTAGNTDGTAAERTAVPM